MMVNNVHDLRSFIGRLEEEGELARIKVEVDWKFELGAIARKAYEISPSPALLFEKVKDYSIPVFTSGLFTFRRIAIALDLDPASDENTIIQKYVERIQHPVKPVW